MKTQKRRSALKIAGLVLLAAAVLFSLVSLAAVQVLFSDTFRRTAPREYTASLRYGDVADQYGREAVSFLSGKNRLRGHLYGGGNPAGLVVISHGLGGGEESYLSEALYFVDHGYQVLCYSNTGCWDSEGKNCVGLSQSLLDLDAALTWAEGESRFDGLPVLLYGHSWGGYAAAAVLHFDHRVTAAASVAGFNDPLPMILSWGEDMMGPLVYAEYPFIWLNQKLTFGDTLSLTAVDAINAAGTPVLLLHGSADGTVGFDTVSIMAARGRITNPNVEYIVRSQEGQNGHNSLFQSPDSIAYREEINRAYEALYEQYGGEIPDDVKEAFYAPIDKRRASAVDGEFMDSVLDFYQRASSMPSD